MISKLPRWIWVGAGILAFSAGMLDVVAIVGFAHQAVTHATGNASLLSIAVAAGDAKALAQTFLILASFFFGAVLGGVIIRDAHLRMGRRYGFALAVESALLLGAACGFWRGLLYGELLAAMAAGLQNSIASTYSGTIIRTTHMTGVLTDLGTLVGHKLHGIPVNNKQIYLLATIFASFLSGALFGAFFSPRLGALAMLLPAAVIGASAVGYELFRGHVARNSKSVIRVPSASPEVASEIVHSR